MALAYDAGGWGGVVVLGAAAFGVTSALLLRLLLQHLRPLPALLFTAAAFVMMAPHLPRAAVRSRLSVHAVVGVGPGRAVEERRPPEPILLLAMLSWANLHGGFTLGLLLGGAFGLEALVAARDWAERRMFRRLGEVRRRRPAGRLHHALRAATRSWSPSRSSVWAMRWR